VARAIGLLRGKRDGNRQKECDRCDPT